MSRDWTPRETYEVEKINIREGRGSLWDFMKNTAWVINDERVPLCTEEQISRRQEYPLLGRLFESYDKLYETLSAVDRGMEILADHEAALKSYIETGKGDTQSPLLRWFEGTLDEGFYYRERNDELLMDYFSDELKRLAPHNSLDTQIREANARTEPSDAGLSPAHDEKSR